MNAQTHTVFFLDVSTRLLQLVCLPHQGRQWVTPSRLMRKPVDKQHKNRVFIEIGRSIFDFDANADFMTAENVCIFLVEDDALSLIDDFMQKHKGLPFASGWDVKDLARLNCHPCIINAVQRYPQLFAHVCSVQELKSEITVEVCDAATG